LRSSIIGGLGGGGLEEERAAGLLRAADVLIAAM
jgi:hypothetical protein